MATCMNTSLPSISPPDLPGVPPVHHSMSADIRKSHLADSYIHLSAGSMGVGHTLNISWLINRPTHTQDWIGLYPADSTRPTEYLEFKKRGESVQKAGIVKWRLNPESFSRPETKCRFKYYSSANELLASSDVITVTHPHCHTDTPRHNMHISDITIREFSGPLSDFHVLFLHVSLVPQEATTGTKESKYISPLTKILLLKTSTGGEISWRSDLIHNLSICPSDELMFEALAVDNPDNDTYKVLGSVPLPRSLHCSPGESKRVGLEMRHEGKQLARLSLTLFFLKPANQIAPTSEVDIPLQHSVSAPHGYRVRHSSLRSDQSSDELDFTPTEVDPAGPLDELTPPTGASGLTKEFSQALQNLKFPLQSLKFDLSPVTDGEDMEICWTRYEQRMNSRYKSNRSLECLDTAPDTPKHVPQGSLGGDEDRKRGPSVLSRGSISFTRDSVIDLLSNLPRFGSLRKRRPTLPQALDPSVRDNPAVRFLLRKDLYSFLEKRGMSPSFSSDLKLLSIVQEVRHSPNTYLKWHRAALLVSYLNRLADTNADMPRDWEMKLSRTKDCVFVNHELRFVTFVDPRLPVARGDIPPPDAVPQKIGTNRKIAGGAGLDRDSVGDTEVDLVELDPSERIIAFLRRDDIFTVVGNVMGEFATPELRAIIREVANRGGDGLERHQNSETLAHFLSMVDQEIEVYNPHQSRRQSNIDQINDTSQRDSERGQFMKKANRFWEELRDKGYDHSWETHTIYIKRDTFLSNAFHHVMQAPALTLRRRHVRVHYDTEEGIDEGGLVKEFFFHLSHELFSPAYGLFEYAADGTYSVQVQKNSTYVRNYELWFRFAGRLMGMSIVQQQLMDVFFSRAIIKPILQEQFTLNDLEAVDPAMYRSLRYVLSNSDTEDLVLTFSYQEELPFGEIRTIDLIKEGHLIPVTNRNKQKYVDLMVESRMSHGVEKQTKALVSGVREIVPLKMLRKFDASELEWLISGTAEIDLADWKANTLYSAGISEQHLVVRNFWRAIEEFENEDRLRLLQFITGSSSIPLNGFQGLTSTHGHIQKFTIRLIFGDGLPESHTCFNRLDIPRYDSYEELKQKLLFAIRNTQGFNVA